MALRKCKECGNEISDSAETCPRCGYKQPKKAGILAWVLGMVVIVAIVRGTQTNSTESSPIDSASPANLVVASEIQKEKSSWEYSKDLDKISGKMTSSASSDSLNSHQLNFPYAGGTTGSLIIRKHPRYGNDVIFSINKGQILCGIHECTVTIKFDNRPPKTYTAVPPSDHSSTYLFIKPTAKLKKEISQAQSVTIEVEFYQSGSRTFEFKVENILKEYL